jgi:hypothetical protein
MIRIYSIGSANEKMAGKPFPAKSVEEENQNKPDDLYKKLNVLVPGRQPDDHRRDKPRAHDAQNRLTQHALHFTHG